MHERVAQALAAGEFEAYVEIKCRHCDHFDDEFQENDEPLSDALKRAWSAGLEHAWENRSHVVETYVDGKLKATQQIAEMNKWQDHRSLVVEEGS